MPAQQRWSLYLAMIISMSSTLPTIMSERACTRHHSKARIYWLPYMLHILQSRKMPSCCSGICVPRKSTIRPDRIKIAFTSLPSLHHPPKTDVSSIPCQESMSLTWKGSEDQACTEEHRRWTKQTGCGPGKASGGCMGRQSWSGHSRCG